MTDTRPKPQPGAGRRIGAGIMVAGAALVLIGLVYLTNAVAAVDEQAADLDPSQSRLERAFVVGAWGAGTATVGLAVFLVGVVPYAVSAHRVTRHMAYASPPPRIAASAAALVVAACLLFGFFAPMGPFMQAASLASGGGGLGGGVQLEEFGGELTAATLGGQSTDERIHVFTPVEPYGAVKVRLVWEASNSASGRIIGILEAADGNGGWTEMGQTDGANDAELDVPPTTYPGDIRLRIVVSDPGLSQAQYGGAISFDPTP